MTATSRRLACAFSLMVALQVPTVCAFAAHPAPPARASGVAIWWPGGRVTPIATRVGGSDPAGASLDPVGRCGDVQAPYLVV